MPRAKQTAEAIAEKHSTKVELVEEPLIIDISWGDWEGKTYKEVFELMMVVIFILLLKK